MLTLLTRPIVGTREVFRSVDIVRGLSALWIVLFHFFHFTMGGAGMSISFAAMDAIPLLRAIPLIMANGGLAVMLFWTISGFVFMNIYAGTRPTLRTFFVNRFSRLYPLHLITLVTLAVLQFVALRRFGHAMIYDNNDAYHFVLQLLFASEWGLQRGRSYNGPIWSVSIEVLIYVAFYFYVRFARVNALTLGAVLAAFIGLARLAPGNSIPVCGILFFAGAAAYALLLAIPPRWRGAAAGAGAAWVAAMLAASYATARPPVPLTLWLAAIFMPLLVALAISEHSRLRAVYRRVAPIGDLTYSSYLWHSPLQIMFMLGAGFGLWSMAIVATSGFVVAYVAVVAGVSYLSFRFIERPAQNALRDVLLPSAPPVKLFSAP